ncbi:MAG: nucleotidyltransferase domain-containing protein [Chloroflexi bacterium]|nr:nucleotidyltransferase domain-containing protein [Chloroflexota bacterium]
MKTLDQKLLAEVVRRIAQAVNPEKIYLYGSHAYGTPREDSDVDLLVLVEKSDLPSYARVRAAYGALRGILIPAEIKMVTKDEFERHLKWVVSIEREAVEKGKIIYERARG